jgi:hypothetical protein
MNDRERFRVVLDTRVRLKDLDPQYATGTSGPSPP